MAETNEVRARELLEAVDADDLSNSDRVVAAIGYAILALADEARNLATEVEKAGWRKE